MSENKFPKIQEKAVIILGAGASKPYGFTTGKELLKKILDFKGDIYITDNKDILGSSDTNIYFNDPKIDDILNPESFTLGENVSENRFGKIVNSRQVFFKDQKNFYQKLKLYKDSQIDYFLRTYKKTYSEYGKLLITRQLIDSEIHSAIKFKTENGEYQDLGNKFKFEFDEKDSKEPDLKGDKKNIDWISHFFANLIQKVKTPNDLKEITENLTIIIFNYDLLFEYCLDRFCTGDGEWEEPLKEFKKKLKIIHIYGKLGKLDWEENNKIYDEDMFDSFVVREFGGNSGVYGEELVNISKGIKVIAEKQDEENQKHIKLAREKIKEAKKIFFFGFGFDRNNLKLLGFDGSSENKKLFNQKELYCSIYDKNEKERALLTIDDLIKDINLDDDQIKLWSQSGAINPNKLNSIIINSKKFRKTKEIDSLLMYL